jgi:hypothetical protein
MEQRGFLPVDIKEIGEGYMECSLVAFFCLNRSFRVWQRPSASGIGEISGARNRMPGTAFRPAVKRDQAGAAFAVFASPAVFASHGQLGRDGTFSYQEVP